MSRPEQRECKEIGALLVFYACQETSEQENARIEGHLAGCAMCNSQLAEERSLHESLMEALQASEQYDTGAILLSQCRSELAEKLDDLSSPPLKQGWQPLGWLRRTMVLRPVLSGAFLVLFGALAGTQVLPWVATRFFDTAPGSPISISARTKFTDEQFKNMSVAGISLAPSTDGVAGDLRVQVRTEEPMVLSGSVDDPDMRMFLTHVVENGVPSDPGVRLDCLEALRQRSSDQDVRRALLHAASKDQNPAVRIKAMDSLREAATEPAVRETLIAALAHDGNPGVRVEAVNLLLHSLEMSSLNYPQAPAPVIAPQGFERPYDASMEQVIRALQELQRSDPSPNVRVRSAAALRQIGSREEQ